MALIEDTPETEIRSDLWNEMSLSQLSHQQELMIAKMTAIMNMAGGGNASQSVMTIYNALQQGFNDLNKLIEYRSAKER